MSKILCFSRNRFTGVEMAGEDTMRSVCRVQDTLFEAGVEILVRLPDLEIVEVRGEIRRSRNGTELDVAGDLQKVTGSRVGPGIKKIVRGIIDGAPDAEKLAAMLEECANGIIMSFTKDVLKGAPEDWTGEKEFFAAMVRANPRLYNSCAALSADSPLMEGLELDKI